MARMRFANTVPPRGWFFIQLETKLRITGESLGDLAAKVVSHRAYKGLPGATLDQAKLDIERQICSRLGKRDCLPEGTSDEWKPVNDVPTLKLSQVMSFSKAAIEWIGSGRELVDKAEADRRAEICKGCPLNNPLVGCKCSIFYKMINKAIPFERRDPGLGICGSCGCSLIAKTNLPASTIKAAESGKTAYPAHCWIPALLE